MLAARAVRSGRAAQSSHGPNRTFRYLALMETSTASDATTPTRRDFIGVLAALGAVSGAAAAGCRSIDAASGVANGKSTTNVDTPPASEEKTASADASTIPTAITAAITATTLAEAEKLVGIAFTDAERAQMLRTMTGQVEDLKRRTSFGAVPNALAPAQVFRVLPRTGKRRAPAATMEPPAQFDDGEPTDDAIDWASVARLARWMQAGKITSRRLVERSIARLKESQPTLLHTITFMEEQALREADVLDAEARAGKWRGPLHGIPYGLKDLFDTKGIATTWGAEPWRDRVPSRDARVVMRLRAAGAVCVAKTAVGALAYGDIWFGGTCKNPWNPAQGSSGSSAGSASAVAAGCVPFAIGTETLGSIMSPSLRCGTTGLRPTFGRVSRDGCMALCWSWDKIGPITRHVEDSGLVLAAINGGGAGRDASNVTSRFTAPRVGDAKGLRFAYDPAWFSGPGEPLANTLDAARDAGIELVERTFEPPCDPSVLTTSLMAEAAAAFEEMTRSGADDALSWQADEAWPNSFRQTWFVPAIELVQVERIRRRFMEWMQQTLADVDGLILPPFAGGFLFVTNATGHPQLILRAGFDNARTPRSISLIGHPFDEATLLRAGMALENRLAVAEKRPQMP